MNKFYADWLALRAPLDLKARNRIVEHAFLEALPVEQPVLLDLASGTGATVRALSGKRPGTLNWILTDHDPELLAEAGSLGEGGAVGTVSTRQIDLFKDLEDLPFSEVDAVTTSAFLDLASAGFLSRLVACLSEAGKPFFASMTYDGRVSFRPQDPFDQLVVQAINEHQLSDKGLGAALGPNAAGHAMELFEAAGFKVVHGPADWHATGSDKDFLREFLSGYHAVGDEVGLDVAGLSQWWSQKCELIEQGRLIAEVGHQDFVALPREYL